MSELVKIAGSVAVVQKLRRARWPNGAWIVYRGNVEASGPTRKDAIYNFEQMLARSDSSPDRGGK